MAVRGMGLGWVVVLCAVPAFAASARDGHFWQDANAGLHASHSHMGTVARNAMPAVVSITTLDAAEEAKQAQKPGSEPQRGVGSGFIIHPDGYVLTCAHVVEDAAQIRVTILNRGGYPEDFTAKVVGTDPETDFALLKVDAHRKLPVLRLGSVRSVDIADWLVVIGSPFGLAHSVSVGVVSYKGRNEVSPGGRAGYFDYLQTDASINPGNSGGPILDVKGDVVAVANAVNVAGQGIGFAVPVDIAKAVLPDLRTRGAVQRGWIGLTVADLTPELAQPRGLNSYEGVLVNEVAPDSPAAKAGIRAGDVILSVGAERLHRAPDVRWKIATGTVGRTLALNVQRAHRAFEARAVLAATPKDTAVAAGATTSSPPSAAVTASEK